MLNAQSLAEIFINTHTYIPSNLKANNESGFAELLGNVQLPKRSESHCVHVELTNVLRALSSNVRR